MDGRNFQYNSKTTAGLEPSLYEDTERYWYAIRRSNPLNCDNNQTDCAYKYKRTDKCKGILRKTWPNVGRQ